MKKYKSPHQKHKAYIARQRRLMQEVIFNEEDLLEIPKSIYEFRKDGVIPICVQVYADSTTEAIEEFEGAVKKINDDIEDNLNLTDFKLVYTLR